MDEQSLTHKDLLYAMHKACFMKREGEDELLREQIMMEYLCFVSNIAAKCPHKQDPLYFFEVGKEILINHENYLAFNEELFGE